VKLFQTIVKKSLGLPYPDTVQDESDEPSLFQKIAVLKKQLHKWLILALNGQLGLYTESAGPSDGTRILLVYSGVNNIGDALTDFSGRTLIERSPYKLDVLLDPSLSDIFKYDRFFSKIYTDLREVNFDEYGFVILNNLGVRTIKNKIKYAKKARFSSLIGWYAGCNYNHIQFSYYSFNKILNSGLDDADLAKSCRLAFAAPRQDRLRPDIGLGAIAIAVGGREFHRTYGKWRDVLAMLDEDVELSRYQYVLVGSENGAEEADALMAAKTWQLNLVSLVGKLTIHESYSLIEQSRLFIGADGGLLHMAHAAGVPTVALFSNDIDPKTRYVENDFFKCSPLMGAGDATSIEPKDVVDVMRDILVPLHHLV
jgi:hypothetical protein